jgi:uncharacterized caspase-like protein
MNALAAALAVLVSGAALATCTSASAPIASAAAQAGPGRWAVVIGVGTYDSASIAPAPYAVGGAEAFHRLLTGSSQFKPDSVLLLTDRTERKPTLRNIKWALGTFLARSARQDDTVLIYFAGQGGVEVDPRGLEPDGFVRYLLAQDAVAGDFYSTALPLDGFLEIFARIEAERVVAFLDASYSGAAGGRTFASRRTPRSVDQWLQQRVLQTKGRAIVASSRPNEMSIGLAELGHGIFTHYLLEGLRGTADRDQDRVVTLHELYEYVEANVTRRSRAMGGSQHPMLKGETEGALPLVRLPLP